MSAARLTFPRPPVSRGRVIMRTINGWASIALVTLAAVAVLAWLTVLPSAGLLWLVGAV